MATLPRDSRTSVQFFDIDLFRNKLESFMRKQAHEMCEITNTKKRKLADRYTEFDKLDLDDSDMYLVEDDDRQTHRDDLCFRFGKRQRGNKVGCSYYPLDDDDVEQEEISPLALPSPATVPAVEESRHSQPWPFFNVGESSTAGPSCAAPPAASPVGSVAMHRQISGYSEIDAEIYREPSHKSSSRHVDMYDEDHENWTYACPTLSRNSLSLSHTSSSASTLLNSTPQTPKLNIDTADDVELTRSYSVSLDLDVDVMAPHERQLLAALAPDRFEKAESMKRDHRTDGFVMSKQEIEDEGDKMTRADDDGAVYQFQISLDDVIMDDHEHQHVSGELMEV